MKVRSDVIISLIFKACIVILLVGLLHTLITKEDIINDVNNKVLKNDATKGDLVFTLSQVAAISPHAPINSTCFPPPLPRYPSCQGETGLTGKRLDKPRKVVLMILFAFEVDTLEIALREQMDLLDKIFIVESTITHKGMPKPLMWERLKFTERFSFVNSSKVVHVVADDQGNTDAAKYEIWYAEYSQTAIGVKKVKNWATRYKTLEMDDIFISADVDEILGRQALHQLKWCETSSDLLSGALWMPLGNLNWALRTGFPVHQKPHTFGLPTIYKWKDIISKKFKGKRLQLEFPDKARQKFVSGGIHMTNPAYMPLAILKELTATEDDFYGGYINTAYLLNMTVKDIDYEQNRYFKLDGRTCWLENIDNIEDSHDVDKYVPWFLDCNPHRYPYWYGRTEPRNQDLFDSLGAIRESIRTVKQTYWEKKNVKKLFSRAILPTLNKSVMGCTGNIFF